MDSSRTSKLSYTVSYSVDTDTLHRFMLTVRKNYRPLAYHSWSHGFSVAHILWLIFTQSPDTFTANEVRSQQSTYQVQSLLFPLLSSLPSPHIHHQHHYYHHKYHYHHRRHAIPIVITITISTTSIVITINSPSW
jgi:hypothetical protein